MKFLKGITNKGEILSWCLFDFANSSFTTIIITVVFSVAFVNVIAGKSASGPFLWSLGNGISQILVLLTAPIVGAIADYSANKKKFLFATYLTCVLFTALLTFVMPGQVLFALIIFMVANFAYSSGENLVAGFLPEIARPEDMGKVSGFGWALGYMGGLASLLFCLPFLKGGFSTSNAAGLRMTNLVTALFFLVAGIPTFIWVKERKKPATLPAAGSYLSVGFQRMKETFQNIRLFRELFKFLIIFGIYNCGVTTVVVFASIYADNTIHLNPQQLIFFFLITQVSASLGAFLFGLIQDKIGAKNTIYITLTLWLAVVIGAYFSTDRISFYIIGNLAGLGLGSSQSAARALVGLFSPASKSGEFFGFWGLFWKLSTAIGPLVFGSLSTITGSQRIAILATGLFFLFGIIGLSFVDERKGREAALAFTG